MTSSYEKFPAEIQITRVIASLISSDMNVYFLNGIMDANQLETIEARMEIQFKYQIDENRWVISTLVSQQKLVEVYNQFTQLGKTFRGAFYVVTNKYVEACKEFVS